MNGTTSNQEAGQFAGDTPLTGHNIQGHSINVMLVRDMPAEVLRTSVTHFGTRGLFGQPVRRTTQHDQDNVRRKRWRVAQSVKPKVKPKPNDRSEGDERQDHHEGSQHSAEVPSPVPGAPGSVNKSGENILDLSPPFRSSSPAIAIPSSSQTSSIRSAQVLPTGKPPIHEKTVQYSRSHTLSGTSKSASTSPTSMDRDEHVPFPGRNLGEPSVPRPPYSSPTPTSFIAYPTTGPSSRCDAPASQDRMSHETRYGRTSTSHYITTIDAPVATEAVDNPSSVDASTITPMFIRQMSSEMRVTTTAEQTFCTVSALRNEPIVDANVDARHSVVLPAQRQLRHEKALHWRREASLSAPRSDRPLATSASHEGWSIQVQASTPSRLNNAPGETRPAWYGYPATAEVYANPSSAIGVAACSSTDPSPGVKTYPVHYMPPVNGYDAAMWSSAIGRHEREGRIVAPPPAPPPSAYPAYSAAPSPANPFNQYAQGDNTPTRVPTVPSDEHIRALVDLYTRPPSGPYAGAAIGSSGPINTSTSAPEAVWPTAPDPYLQANGANPNLDTRYGGALSVGASSTANAYPSGAVPTGSETYYPHTFVGSLGTSTSPLWAHQVRPMDPTCAYHASLWRGLQQEHDEHAIAPWTHHSGLEPGYPAHGADSH
ncbi:hypothetical protein V8D89_001918 [Ganoderma adspersum]